MRERWFGATGRRVPEIALEDELELGDSALADAHRRGQPVVVRARTAADVKAALSRPEVAVALVTDRSLLDLDLTELTYG